MEDSTNPFSTLRAKQKIVSIISKFQQLADDSTTDMTSLKQNCKELASTLSALNWDMHIHHLTPESKDVELAINVLRKAIVYQTDNHDSTIVKIETAIRVLEDMQLQQRNHFSYFTGWKLQSVEPFNPQGTNEQRFIDGPYLVIIEMEVFNNDDERQVVHYMKEVDAKYYSATDDLKLNLSLGKNERIVMWARQDELIEGLKGLF